MPELNVFNGHKCRHRAQYFANKLSVAVSVPFRWKCGSLSGDHGATLHQRDTDAQSSDNRRSLGWIYRRGYRIEGKAAGIHCYSL